VAFAGSNKDTYPTLQGATVDIGGSTVPLTPNGQRVYVNDGTFPSSTFTWPTLSDPDARACVSFRPPLFEVANLGMYPGIKSELDSFLMGAPQTGAPSLVALWHEASTTGPGMSYNKNSTPPGYFDSLDANFPGEGGAAGLLRQAQASVQTRAQQVGANVLVGAVEVVNKPGTSSDTTGASKLASQLNPWMAENLDFYAADVYDNADGDFVPSILLNAFQSIAVAKMTNGAFPTIGIGETNSRFPGRRPQWFTDVWAWLQNHSHTSDRVCFLTFWHPTGIESGAWIPEDWATIDALAGIFAESAP
jgi:hypothetical protein